MAATSIFFNGRVISTPGAYSFTDASGLEQVGLSASGIVAVLGTAEGGMPVSAVTDVSQLTRFTKPSQANTTYRSGDLLEVANMLFAPSNDPNIPGGAQQVISLKVNPATQASATLSNSTGPCLVITSQDWGAFTSQINVTVANGSVQGKMLTVQFEDVTESVDNLGGSSISSLQYVTTGTSWSTVTAGVEQNGSIHTNGTRVLAGLTGSIAAVTGGPIALSVLGTSGDAGKIVSIYGANGSAALVREDVTLVNGTATTINQFATLYGVYARTALTGNVTVQSGATVLATLTSAVQQVGVSLWSYGYVNTAPVTFVAASATTAKIVVEGLNSYGSTVREFVTLNGTTPVQTTNSYTQLSLIGLAQAATGNAITVSALVARADATVQSTVQKQADFFNAKGAVVSGSNYGFVYTIAPSVATNSALAANSLDPTTADVTVIGSSLSFYANLYAIINWVNTNSQLINAAEATGAVGAPSNTGGAIFLTGGTEGTTTFAQWQQALNFLKLIRVNTVVPLTSDPATAAAVDAHCSYMNGVGRSERDGLVGLMNPGLTDVPTKTQLEAQIQALNTRNLRCTAQAVTRYNSQGVLQEFPPHFYAAIGAGMQAGATVGTSLTFKYINCVSVRQDPTWNPVDDSEELIQAGLFFSQVVDGVGIRWVRNVTSYLQSNNIAYTEASVNQAVNFAAYNFRTNLEVAVGQPGFAGTINATRSVALGTLGQLVDQGILTTWRALDISLNVDVMQVSVEMAPILPVNFVPITIHLVTVPQSGTPTAAQ